MSQFDEPAENIGKCAYADAPPRFVGYLCEREAGHYPGTPHAALLGWHDGGPVYWDNAGQKADEHGEPPTRHFDRVEVEAKLAANDTILQALAKRGVGVNVGDLLTTYVALIVERLFGDMDDQRRLELENAYADLASQRLESTMSAVDRALLTHGTNAAGLYVPGSGPS